MYLSHYNLDCKPFQMTMDPNFLWLGEKHKETLASLKYAILENKGILTLIGDVGTGKSTFIHALIQSLGDDTLTAIIYDPSVGVLEFFNIISTGFKMGRTLDGKGEFLIYFKRFLKKVREQNKKALLIIDDAQRISDELLEEIRLLLSFEDEHYRVLNIIFLGQTEFIDILNKDKNKRLTQRIANRDHTEPLTQIETDAYIEHRLDIAGARSDIFNSDAIQAIFSLSNGYPRLINVICDHALLSGYVRKIAIIDKDIIIECNKDLKISYLDKERDTHDSYDDIKLKPKSSDTQQCADDCSGESDSKSKISDIQKDTYNSVDKSESKPEIQIIKQEKSPGHRKTPLLIKGNRLYKRFETIKEVAGDSVKKSSIKSPGKKIKQISILFLLFMILGVVYFPGTLGSYIGNIKKYFKLSPNQEVKLKSSDLSQNENQKIIFHPTPKELQTFDNTHSPSRNLTSKNNEISGQKGHIMEPPKGDKTHKILKDPMLGSMSDRKNIIYFGYASNDLSDEAFETLKQVAELIDQYPNSEIIVKGYTDAYGDYNYNKKLSGFRANLVKSFFVGQGISPSRIRTFAMGSEDPRESNKTLEGRKLNRRVEITLNSKNQ